MALILIADSSAQERQRLRKIVETQDHVVVEADSAAYCLEIAEYHHPQCVLLNLLISGEPDLDLLKSLQALAISTIVVIDAAQPDTRQHCLDLGVSYILFLHPNQDDLLNSLSGTLETEVTVQSQPISESLSPDGVEPQSQPFPQATPESSKVQVLQQLLSIDKLQYLIGLGSDTASETLTDLTDCAIQFQSPTVETMTAKSLQQLLQGRFGPEPICAAQLPFTGGLNGTAQLFFPQASALSLTAMLTGESPDSPDFEVMKQEALTEVGNIVLNSVMGAISNALTQQLTFAVPIYQEAPVAELTQALDQDAGAVIILAQTHFNIEELQISGDIILFFKMQLFFDFADSTLT
ncbi:MAG: response regulator [Cyanobacteria bacterium P01_F01_bin.4]